MVAIATHAITDRPSLWTTQFQAPPVFNIKEYQEKLDQIAGKTQQGEPVLRLVWGGSEWKLKAVAWDSWGTPIEWDRVPRHAFLSKDPLTFGRPVPIRRWIIEENTDAGQLEAMGGKNHGNLQFTEKGFYTPYIIIADHSKCHNCKANEFKCFGDYKAPGYDELQFITEVTYKLLASRKQDPRKGIDLDLAAELTEKPNVEEEKELEQEEERRFIKGWLKTHTPIRVDYGSSTDKV